MNYQHLIICIGFSVVLMVLFVLINFPYYKLTYGEKTNKTVIRTVLLNSLAIIISWLPVMYFWPEFSYTILLPFVCVVAGLGCVGSRFIYHEIIPETLAKSIIEIVERKSKENK
jgi:hypothetical protein